MKSQNGPVTKIPVPGDKNDAGQFTLPDNKLGGLDEILRRQLLALERVTIQLTRKSSTAEGLTKAEIDSLATCIEVTLKLKAKEKELLDGLSDTELENIATGA